MADIVLFEDAGAYDLLPLTYWRSVFELRMGRRIILDRSAQMLKRTISGVWVRDWYAPVAETRCGAPVNQPLNAGDVLVNGRWIMPGPVDFDEAPSVGVVGDEIAYVHCNEALAHALTPSTPLETVAFRELTQRMTPTGAMGWMLRYPWDITARLDDSLRSEWQPADAAMESALDARVVVIGEGKIHVGERTSIMPTVTLDASNGPICISHDVRIGGAAVIEGPAYIGPGTIINPHAWIHGGNAIGPVCKVGGELDGCVIHGYANKQHAGFLGHAYVGSWANIGAGATNSDLKNTYGRVRVPLRGQSIDSGQMFFGAVIGDHAKLGINATIPTGAAIGFAANVATAGVCPKFVPSFSWVTERGTEPGDPSRLLDVATAAMARRNVDMTDAEIELFLSLLQRARELENAEILGFDQRLP